MLDNLEFLKKKSNYKILIILEGNIINEIIYYRFQLYLIVEIIINK